MIMIQVNQAQNLPFRGLNSSSFYGAIPEQERSVPSSNLIGQFNWRYDLQIDNIHKLIKIEDNINKLEKDYVMVDKDEVKNFIYNHPFLIPILREAPENIKNIFGKGTILILEIILDSEENYRELFIVIKSKYKSKKARQLMDKLDSKWFLGKINQTKGKLCITEEPYDL
jgi:hypothetical protein